MTAPRLSRAVASLSTAALLCGTMFALPAAAAEKPAIDPRPAPPPSTSAAPEPAAAAGRFLVKFKAGTAGTASARANAYGQAGKAAGVTVKELRTTARGAAVIQAAETVTKGEAAKVLASLRSRTDVEYAEPDTFLRQTSTPNDPLYPNQWDLFESTAGMRVPAAWDTTTGQGTVVAVIDTGITPHSDLPNVLPGYDFISDTTMSNDGDGRDSNANDAGDYCNGSSSSWHGTHVAGTIGAAANNGIGIAGVAYSAKILPVRALGACGGYLSDIADAVVWASGGAVTGAPANPNRAKVINMSLGGFGQCGTYFQSALDFANAQGVTVVAAAGNDNAAASGSTPANCNNIITVGATGREGNRAYYSNYGPEVDVSAPGGDGSTGGQNTILSTWNDGTTVQGAGAYGYMQGTSMATPHVAGAAALIMTANPSLTPAQVEAVLKQTARPLPGTCDTGGCGTGLVDAAAAVRAATTGTVTPEPGVAGKPSIQGTPKVGSVLTADPGTWTPGPVTFAYEWLRNDAPIEGATDKTYSPVAADMGATLKVRVTGTSPSFNGVQVTSEATAAVAEGTQPSPAPSITGTAAVGQVLMLEPGSWAPDTTLTYEWFRDGESTGVTGNNYLLTTADLGQTFTVAVTGTKDGYAPLTVTTAPTAAVTLAAFNPAVPRLYSAQVGRMAYAYNTVSSWPTGTRFTSAWYRDGVQIPGAYTEDYGVLPEDFGHTLTYSVTGTKDGYAPKTISAAARVLAGEFKYPYVRVSGEAKVGQTLSAVFSSSYWSLWGQRAPEIKKTWQWYRSGAAITGATGSTYTLTAADLDKNIYVRVIASLPGYTTAAVESSDLLGRLGTFTASPVISGTKKVGYTLTALPQTPVAGATVKYQWYRSGYAVSGSTAAKYTLTAADLGKTMRVRVSLSKSGYAPLTAYSATTTAVVAGTLVAGTPWISGYPRYGYTLTANPRTWTSGTTLRYQWYRSGVAIRGATGRTYRLVWADRYDTIKVRVVGSKAGYSTVTKYSGSTLRIR